MEKSHHYFKLVCRSWLALCGCVIALQAGVALADDARARVARAMSDPDTFTASVEAGRKASFFCANCHGEDGVSRLPDVPNLAGQHPDYLLDQIEAFLSGKRKDEFMQGLMKVLNEEEKAAIALFYAAAQPRPAIATPGPMAGKGQALFAELCARCHQPDAGGAASFPRLAGQQPDYLRVSLKRYLDMTGERIYPPMTGAIRQLGEENIPAMVEYLSSKR